MKISNKKFVCVCGKKIRISNIQLGKTGSCPNCDKKILVSKTFFQEQSFSEDATFVDRTTMHSIPITEKEFGDYEIEHKLGQGGMGIVYKAYEKQIKRVVALKVISHGSESMVHRFQKEMEILGKLQHPNIVRLLSYGTTPQMYLTMEYLEGKVLTEINNLSFRQIARVIRKIALALQDAHEQGIIHRDIKPANIMLVGKEPKLMDFGLAKLQQDDEQISKTGELLGTVAYMSPEQAYGAPLTGATDIYSLGATIYKLLTLRPPFEGDNNINIIFRVCYKDVVSPRVLNPDIPVDLEAICLKCLEKDPRKRYTSANYLAEDLDNYLNGRSVVARPYTTIKKVYRYLVRYKLVFGLVLFCLLLSVTFTFLHIQHLEKSRLASAKKHRSSSTVLAKFAAYNAETKFRIGLIKESGIFSGKSLQFLKGLEGQSVDEIRRKNQEMLNRSLRHHGLVWQRKSDDKFSHVDKLIFNKNGNLLAALDFKGLIRVWDIKKNRKIAEIKHNISQMVTVVFTPKNDLLFICQNGLIHQYDFHKITLFGELNKSISKTSFVFPNIYFTSSNELYQFNVSSKKTILLASYKNNITELDATKKKILSATSRIVEILNVRTKKVQRWKKNAKLKSLKLCFNNSYLAGCQSGSLVILDLSGHQINKKNYNISGGRIETHSKNDNIVIVVTPRHLMIVDISNPKKPSAIDHMNETVEQYSIQPQKKYIATSNKSGVFLWDRSFALDSSNVIFSKKIRKLRSHFGKLVVLQKQISLRVNNKKVWESNILEKINDFYISKNHIVVETVNENIIYTMSGELFYRCPKKKFMRINGSGSQIVYYDEDDNCICIQETKDNSLKQMILPKETICTSLFTNHSFRIFLTTNRNLLKIIDPQTFSTIYQKTFAITHRILKCLNGNAYLISKDFHLKVINGQGDILKNIPEVLNDWYVDDKFIVLFRNSYAIFFKTTVNKNIFALFPVEGATNVVFLGQKIIFVHPHKLHVCKMKNIVQNFQINRLFPKSKQTSFIKYISDYPQEFTENIFNGKLNENFEVEFFSH
ncbi:protein kinase [Candidatus Uabimicrobium sp. HlEnr_7]|uniref:serine/threonine protein kinase n=1 Tax=Candidatus Uabimicrobium helgolandensis TaxID=3095367 RepID=UPI003558CF6F